MKIGVYSVTVGVRGGTNVLVESSTVEFATGAQSKRVITLLPNHFHALDTMHLTSFLLSRITIQDPETTREGPE